MKSLNWPFLFLFSAIINIPPLAAQEAQDPMAAYKWFDAVVGKENTGLFNGIEYIEQHVTVNDRQKFLGSIYYSPGSLVYEGQPYYEVDMKYNVYDDLLLLRGTGSKPLQIHQSRIAEFHLDGYDFININADTTAAVHGFYEVLLETGQLKLLKKHRKKYRKFLDRSYTYYEFYDDTPGYAIAIEEDFHPANSRREVISAFPGNAREIRRFYRERRKLSKNNPDIFMRELAGRLEQLSHSNTAGK
ncbi:hypothetical protein FHG64_06115 [Antarcticibacterium flavum]|uniref:DUF4369 domain-containing protein n=1 Tax=Antarcticibacterium flavum TaxID=2058175 RepID=A0A5B7X1P3_9FLAO|nr:MULTISPECIES: hypothetical protein [Antarcticibacterium]MCM4160974.1 hypothetical protein [Antarcticibacterium sp. W02-3]QCY69015.1 hypothetical protein FHG64_06115 [Antarcticibacterium flavum]